MKHLDIALALIKEAENFYPNEYYCPAGKLTQGYGRNLEVHPLSASEKAELVNGLVSEPIATQWALKELNQCENQLKDNKVYQTLSDVRKAIMLDMAFNMGIKGLMDFKKMWAALAKQDFITAASEMKDSSWYRQTKTRAVRNVAMMEKNIVIKKG